MNTAKRLFGGLLRVALGLLFVYAASTKLADMAQFAEEIANFRLLPAALVPLFAALVMGVEIAAGTLLVLGTATRAAASVIGALLILFIAALSQALLRGVDLRCGCFGGADLATWGTVGRDVAMLLAALIVLRLPPTDDPLSAPPDSSDSNDSSNLSKPSESSEPSQPSEPSQR